MKTPRIARFLTLFVLSIAYLATAEAGVYKCLDAQKRVFYQDKPCQDLTTAKLPSHLTQRGDKAEARHFLWKATAGKGTAYLLGSIHFGTQDLYPLPVRVMDAYRSADVLVVESNVENAVASETANKLTTAGTYADGSNLESHVKPSSWQRLIQTAQKLGIPEDTLRPQKPWMAALTLTATALKSAGYDQSLGIDQSFIKETGSKKPILEMESVDQQIRLFDEFSPLEQEQMLVQTLQDVGKGPELFKQIVDAWKAGDVDAMDIIVRQGFDSGPTGSKLFKVLFGDRNTAMANKIDELAGDGRTYFVVIGAGHLGGEQGILRLLEQKGYAVSQP